MRRDQARSGLPRVEPVRRTCDLPFLELNMQLSLPPFARLVALHYGATIRDSNTVRQGNTYCPDTVRGDELLQFRHLFHHRLDVFPRQEHLRAMRRVRLANVGDNLQRFAAAKHGGECFLHFVSEQLGQPQERRLTTSLVGMWIASRSSCFTFPAIARTLSTAASTLMRAMCSSAAPWASSSSSTNECESATLSDSRNVIEVSGQPQVFVSATIAGQSAGVVVFGRPLTMGAMCVSMAMWRRCCKPASVEGNGTESWGMEKCQQSRCIPFRHV